jgi:hypothetical protein
MSPLTCFGRFVSVKPIILFKVACINASNVYSVTVYIMSY